MHDLAVDAALDVRRVERRHRAQADQVDRHILLLHLGHGHRNRARSGSLRLLLFGVARWCSRERCANQRSATARTSAKASGVGELVSSRENSNRVIIHRFSRVATSFTQTRRRTCHLLDVFIVDSVAATLPGKGSRLSAPRSSRWRGSGRNRNADVIVEPLPNQHQLRRGGRSRPGRRFYKSLLALTVRLRSMRHAALRARDAALRTRQSPLRVAE